MTDHGPTADKKLLTSDNYGLLLPIQDLGLQMCARDGSPDNGSISLLVELIPVRYNEEMKSNLVPS